MIAQQLAQKKIVRQGAFLQGVVSNKRVIAAMRQNSGRRHLVLVMVARSVHAITSLRFCAATILYVCATIPEPFQHVPVSSLAPGHVSVALTWLLPPVVAHHLQEA